MPILSDGTVIEVELPSTKVMEVGVIIGPPGPSGGGSSIGVELVQTTPSASWVFSVPGGFSRKPAVTVYVAGEIVAADVTANLSTVSVTFPTPASGSVVLT